MVYQTGATRATEVIPNAYKLLYGAVMAKDDKPYTHKDFEKEFGRPTSLAWEYNLVAQLPALRESRGMTQTDLAKFLKSWGLPFHQQTIQRIESGERPVRLNEAYLIARLFDVDLDSLTMTEAPPTARAIRIAVDRMRVGSSRTMDEINEVMGAWAETVEPLIFELIGSSSSAADLESDPVLRWAVLWAHKILRAYDLLMDAWEGLAGISRDPQVRGGEREVWSFSLPAINENLREWLVRSRLAREAQQLSAEDLYAQFPNEAEGESIPQGRGLSRFAKAHRYTNETFKDELPIAPREERDDGES